LDKKTGARLLSFDSTWDGLYAHLLKLLGFGEDVVITIRWSPVQTIDEDEKVALASAKQAAGVPAEQTLKEDLGYDGDTVDQWMEDGEALIPQTLEQVGSLATTISSLVPAETAGVLEPGSVQALFKMLVDEIRGESGDDTEFTPTPVESAEPDPGEQPVQPVVIDSTAIGQQPGNGGPVNGGRPRPGGAPAGSGRRVSRR
jgi:hypothetical protein